MLGKSNEKNQGKKRKERNENSKKVFGKLRIERKRMMIK